MPLNDTLPARKIRSLWPGADEGRKRWMLASAAGALAASLLTRGVLTGGYRGLRGKKAPYEPTGENGGWPRALAWGAATGVVVGIARVLGRRAAAGAWEKTAGSKPPS